MLSIDNKSADTQTDERREVQAIAELLDCLRRASSEQEEAAIWSDIWNALTQAFNTGAPFYSIVPRVAMVATDKTLDGRLEYLHFVGVVEALRHQKEAPALPLDIREDYFAALETTESLIIECLGIDWDESGYRSLLGSLASIRAGLEFRESHHGNIW